MGTLFTAYSAILSELASMTQGVDVSPEHAHSILNWIEDQVKASFAESRASGGEDKRTAGIQYTPAVVRVETAPGQIRELPTIAVTIKPVPQKAEGTVGILFPGSPSSPSMLSVRGELDEHKGNDLWRNDWRVLASINGYCKAGAGTDARFGVLHDIVARSF